MYVGELGAGRSGGRVSARIRSYSTFQRKRAAGRQRFGDPVARRRGAPFRGLPGRVARLYGRRRRADLQCGPLRRQLRYRRPGGDRECRRDDLRRGNGVRQRRGSGGRQRGGRARSADIRRTDGADRLCDRDVPSPSADGAADECDDRRLCRTARFAARDDRRGQPDRQYAVAVQRSGRGVRRRGRRVVPTQRDGQQHAAVAVDGGRWRDGVRFHPGVFGAGRYGFDAAPLFRRRRGCDRERFFGREFAVFRQQPLQSRRSVRGVRRALYGVASPRDAADRRVFFVFQRRQRGQSEQPHV